MNTGKGRKKAPEYNVVFERPLRDEYGLDSREARRVWAQPTEGLLPEEYGLEAQKTDAHPSISEAPLAERNV